MLPHGGGAVPFHWGRYRGIAQDMGRPPLDELLLGNLYFDTCVYHQDGIDLLVQVMGAQNVIFASEMIGAVRGIDERTGRYFDDTKPYVDAVPRITEAEKRRIFEENALEAYPLLRDRLAASPH